MNKQQTITINGVAYDAHTGMRVEQQTSEPKQQHAAVTKSAHTPRMSPASNNLHAKQQRTQTLSRKHVHAPVKRTASPQHAIIHSHRKPAHPSQQTTKVSSPMVTKFARDIAPVKKPAQSATPDIAAVKHPAAQRAHTAQLHRTAAKTAAPAQPRPAQEIKHRAIAEAMEKTASMNTKTKKTKKPLLARHPRMASIATASLALVLLAGYLTYINLPTISVKVAAAQAGIAAAYPSYQPSGYSLTGPVAFSKGQVSMKFAANGGPQNFTVNQVQSNWDSSALLDNYVYQASSGDYDTFKDSGLTIYVYGNDAAWVNDGILHTVKGDASLTNDQIRKLATSM